jgi:cytochrome P450
MTRTVKAPLPEVLEWPPDFGDHSGEPPIYTRMRVERPVQPLRLPTGVVMYLLTHRDDIQMVLTDSRFSRDLADPDNPQMLPYNITSMPGSIFNTDGAAHHRIRLVLRGLFTKPAIETHRSMITELTRQHLDALATKPQPADLVEHLVVPLTIDLSGRFLEYDVADRVNLVRQFQTQTDLTVDEDGMLASTAVVTELAEKIIADKSADPDPRNPIGALILACRAGTITELEMYGTTHLLLLTTTDPLAGPFCSGVISLITNQLVPELLGHPALWSKAVEEVLRKHHNAAMSFPRIALEDVEIHGTLIRKGDAVLTPYIAATNDPAHYPHPERFDIHRTTDGTMTFGHGPHFCLGANLARLFLNVALRALFTRFPTMELAVPPAQIPWEDTVIITRPHELPVVW